MLFGLLSEKGWVFRPHTCNCKRAVIGSNGGWNLSIIFKLRSASRLVNNKIMGNKKTGIYWLHFLK